MGLAASGEDENRCTPRDGPQFLSVFASGQRRLPSAQMRGCSEPQNIPSVTNKATTTVVMVATHKRVVFGRVIQSQYSDKVARRVMRKIAAIFIQAFPSYDTRQPLCPRGSSFLTAAAYIFRGWPTLRDFRRVGATDLDDPNQPRTRDRNRQRTPRPSKPAKTGAASVPDGIGRKRWASPPGSNLGGGTEGTFHFASR
jgi:hypothetical protein